MSENDSPANDAGTLSLDKVSSAVESYTNKRKTRTYDLPDPENPDETITLEFEYRMLSEEEKDEISQSTSKVKPGRTGQDDEVDVDIAQSRLMFLKKGITDSNIEGFTLSERGIKEATTPDIREDLSDAIADFSEMPESERLAFR